MNKRIAGLLGLILGIVLLWASAGSRSWFVAPTDGKVEGYKLEIGPVIAEACQPDYSKSSFKPGAKLEPKGVECKTETLMKNARGDEMELWAAMGLGYAGAVGMLSLWYLITIILGAIKSRGNRILGWITLAFTFITMLNGVAFVVMIPDKGAGKVLETSFGMYLMVLGGLIGMAGCVLSALGVPPKKDPLAAAMGGMAPMGNMGGPMGAPPGGMGGQMGGPQSGGYPPSSGMGGPGMGGPGMGGPGMGGPGMGGPGMGGPGMGGPGMGGAGGPGGGYPGQ